MVFTFPYFASGLYFHSKDVWEPEIGDVRVQFAYAGKDGEQVTTIDTATQSLTTKS